MSAPDARVNIEFTKASERLGPRARRALVDVLTHTIDDTFPVGFNLSIVDRSNVLFRAWGGHANIVGDVVETRDDTIYDLASLTKVVTTTTLALWLVDQRKWSLDQPLAQWLPDFERRDITLFQLLTHTSGIVAHRPFFHLGPHRAAVRRAVLAESQRARRPGRVLYSDLNFMLLGWAVEQCAGESLEHLFQRVVAGPLSMTDTGFNPRGARARRAAATELNGDQRLEPVLIRGRVHDGNAWSLGGVAGHAGLFSSAADLSTFVQSFLPPRRHAILSARIQTRMSSPQAGRQPDVRGLGWRLEPRGWGHWPEGTIWHTGFTGTSLLISPRTNMGVVLLANAVHPARDPQRQAAFRAAVHRAIAKAPS
jgi:CubicO group peptidase (beta-lactamase class C family)